MIKGLDFHRVSDQQNYCTIPGELPTKVAKTCITPENLGRGYWSLTVLWCSRKFSLSVSSQWRGWCRKQSLDFHTCQDHRSIENFGSEEPLGSFSFLVPLSQQTTSHMFTWRVDATIKSNIMDHMDNMVCWESASLSSLMGNASGKMLQF